MPGDGRIAGRVALDGRIIEGLEHRDLDIADVKVFRAKRREDVRGFVEPAYSRAYFRHLGIETEFVHENHCFSPHPFTVRGFHYQLPPYPQAKLIRITRGRMLDVNVDLRAGSPTFGRHVTAELTPDGWSQIYVPGEFAHCYATLEPGTEVIFRLGEYYAPERARGLAWNDPDLAVDWPFAADRAIVIDRDLDRPRFSELSEFF